MTNPNCRVLIFSILRFISTKCCKTQITLFFQLPYNLNLLLIERATNSVLYLTDICSSWLSRCLMTVEL